MRDLFDRNVENLGPIGRYADIAEGEYVFPKLDGPIGPRMTFKGKEMVVWSINDYLGLGSNEEIKKVDAEAAANYGFSTPMGSRMMSGHTDYHEQFERMAAEFVQKEAAYLLNFGYQGITSIIEALVNRNDVIVYDKESHACIIDGCHLHKGKRFGFKHNDVKDLEVKLKAAKDHIGDGDGGILVITEGVFGMNSHQGDLKGIVALKEQYNFRIFVDDAHGFGVLGKTGAGAGEEQGVQDKIDLYLATFAKSMASIGAFVAGDKDIIKYLKYNMRSQIYAKSMPKALVIGNIKRLEVIKNNPSLKEKLWDNVRNLRSGLQEAGFDVGKNPEACITPVKMLGSVNQAMKLVGDLRQSHGIFCSIVVYPVIPEGQMILRLIPTAAHSEKELTETIQAFKVVRKKLEEGAYGT